MNSYAAEMRLVLGALASAMVDAAVGQAFTECLRAPASYTHIECKRVLGCVNLTRDSMLAR